MSLPRRTPIPQGKPLERGTPLKSGAGLARGGPLRRATTLQPGTGLPRAGKGPEGGAGGVPMPRRPQRRTGPSPKVVALVEARDGGVCVVGVTCHGLAGAEVTHHRLNRGIGGSSNAEINMPSNLLAACSDCNLFLESSTSREFYENGWKVRHGHLKSSDVPVLYPDGNMYYLDDDGRRKSV